MRISEQELICCYRQMDWDPHCLRQEQTYRQINCNGNMKRIWRYSAVCLAAGLFVWAGLAFFVRQEIPVRPAPAWLEAQADFSMYESPDGELLVSVSRRYL